MPSSGTMKTLKRTNDRQTFGAPYSQHSSCLPMIFLLLRFVFFPFTLTNWHSQICTYVQATGCRTTRNYSNKFIRKHIDRPLTGYGGCHCFPANTQCISGPNAVFSIHFRLSDEVLPCVICKIYDSVCIYSALYASTTCNNFY